MVDVNNVAPTATLGNNGPVDEGSSATVSFSQPVRPVDRGHDGRLPLRLRCSNGDPGRRDLRRHRQPAPRRAAPSTTTAHYTVKARIIDKDGGFTEYTTDVTVNNVAPTATFGNNGPVNEGSSGDGELHQPVRPVERGHDGGLPLRLQLRRRAFARPAATYAGSRHQRLDELHLRRQRQPTRSRPDHRQGRRLHRVHHRRHGQQRRADRDARQQRPGRRGQPGDGHASPARPTRRTRGHDGGLPLRTSTATAARLRARPTYAGSGTSASHELHLRRRRRPRTPCAARIIDKDGGFSEYTTDVTVNNVAPTATLGNNGPVNEGSSATVSFTSPSDPSSADTTAGFHYAFACDGALLRAGDLRRQRHERLDELRLRRQRRLHGARPDHRQGRRLHRLHHRRDRQQRRPVDHGAFGSELERGREPLLRPGTFSDPGFDSPWQVSVDWGDSARRPTTRSPVAAPPRTSASGQSRTPTDGPNDYTVTVTVTDKDGGSDTKTFWCTSTTSPRR